MLTSIHVSNVIYYYISGYHTSLCAAIPNEDYQAIPRQTFTFSPSTSIICVPVLILDDDLLESTEDITLALTPSLEDVAVVNISYPQATVEIFEDSIDGMQDNFILGVFMSLQSSTC